MAYIWQQAAVYLSKNLTLKQFLLHRKYGPTVFKVFLSACPSYLMQLKSLRCAHVFVFGACFGALKGEACICFYFKCKNNILRFLKKISHYSFITNLSLGVLSERTGTKPQISTINQEKSLSPSHAQPECPRTWCFPLEKRLKCFKMTHIFNHPQSRVQSSALSKTV